MVRLPEEQPVCRRFDGVRRTKFITPAIVGPGGSKWNVKTQVLEERTFTKGRVIVRGKAVTRGEARKADNILFIKECSRFVAEWRLKNFQKYENHVENVLKRRAGQ